MFNKNIETTADVREFFLYLVRQEKLNFHPDTDFADYVSHETGKPTFSREETANYNRLMDDSFAICERENADIYDLAFCIMKGVCHE